LSILKIILFFTLITVCASSYAQTVKVIDNKGTIRDIELGIGNVAEIYDATGGQSISQTSFSVINFSTVGIVDSDYTTSSSSITITKPGRYEITYRVSTQTTNNERNGGEFYLEVAGTESPGTRSYTYSRNNVVDKNSVSVTKIIAVSSTTIIKVKGKVYASSKGGISSSVNMAINGSSLIVKRIK
jgi:hypothetical protein